MRVEPLTETDDLVSDRMFGDTGHGIVDEVGRGRVAGVEPRSDATADLDRSQPGRQQYRALADVASSSTRSCSDSGSSTTRLRSALLSR